MNFHQSPMLVIWEATQACDLACVHCRASAQSERHPEELTTEQGFRLLDEIRSFGEPLMVFTGGDPLKRPDLYELIRVRYETAPIVITSNRAIEEWPPLFGDALLASAAMDRLLHHAHVIDIEGESYRNPPSKRRAPRAAKVA